MGQGGQDGQTDRHRRRRPRPESRPSPEKRGKHEQEGQHDQKNQVEVVTRFGVRRIKQKGLGGEGHGQHRFKNPGPFQRPEGIPFADQPHDFPYGQGHPGDGHGQGDKDQRLVYRESDLRP